MPTPQSQPCKLLAPEECNLVWGERGRTTREMPPDISAKAHDRAEEERLGHRPAAALEEFEGGMCAE